MTPLRVCVDARLGSGISGGVEQVVIGLAAGLSKLDDGGEEYLFLTHPDQDEWIRPHLGGPCRLLHSSLEYPGQGGLARSLKRGVRLRASRFTTRGLLQRSDGAIERAGVDLIHFPMQEAFLTEVPSIYQPHDLQHLHLPELFSARERRRREVVYRTNCERASLVVMMTSWGKRDLVEHYELSPEKIDVITWGSVLSEFPPPTSGDLDRLRDRLALPPDFLLYPAQTWPHKNHERLLDALALVRDRHGIAIPLVCPGRRNRFYRRIGERVRRLELGTTTWFPGFVSSLELRGLYTLARGLVFPSRFEGWGMPVTEAFASGVPVASSSATGLPEVVGDAGLIFDPEQPEEIADRVHRLWTDADLRRRLIELGSRRAEQFSVDRSVRRFRAHYRRLAGKTASEEDRILLASPPMA